MTIFVFCFFWSYVLAGVTLGRFSAWCGPGLTTQFSKEPSIPRQLLSVRLHLGFKAVAVSIKGEIHATRFMTWFFEITAFFLLFGIFGGTDGHLVPFTVVGFRTTHHVGLLQSVLWSKPLNWSSIFKSSLMNICCSVLLLYLKAEIMPKYSGNGVLLFPE
jgi:hypothetical protein